MTTAPAAGRLRDDASLTQLETSSMPLRFAFSTVACPDWTLEKVLEQAKAMDYAGVELRTLGDVAGGATATKLACDPALSDPAVVRQRFADAGLTPACLSTSICLHHADVTAARTAMAQTTRAIELAAAIGCPAVRVFASALRPGESRTAVIQRVAARVRTLADKAAEQGVQLLMENAGSFARARDWWTMLDLAHHPAAGMCWNVANAAVAGESPAVSVSALHSRIRMAKVKDLTIGEGSGFKPLGEGDVAVEDFIKRLLGIGFDGFVSVEWDRLWLPGLAPAEEALPAARQRIQSWLDAIEAALPKKKPAKASPRETAAAAG
jgi:sugar phosphate isomerase/epimerase